MAAARVFPGGVFQPGGAPLALAVAAAVLALTHGFCAAEGRTLMDLGLRLERAGHALPAGLAAGLGLAAVLLAVLGAAGAVEIRGAGPAAPLSLHTASVWAPLLAAFGAAALAEEVAARGYVLQTLARPWGAAPASAASALFFAAAHAFNPGVTPLALLSLFTGGLLLAAAWLRTGTLWFPIGVHAGWNAALAAVGLPVSGWRGPDAALILLAPRGAAFLSGGSFGPEASIAAPLVLGCAAILLIAGRRPARTGVVPPPANC